MGKGSDVASLNSHQRTPLHLAVQAGSLETVRLLLSPMLPNTLEIKDAGGNTPLHIACSLNRLEILRFFLDQGADVTALNNENMTCLDVAIEWDSVEVAKTLVKHKRCVNVGTVSIFPHITHLIIIIVFQFSLTFVAFAPLVNRISKASILPFETVM